MFKVYHNDDQMDVVNRISANLKEFGLTIVETDGGKGWVEYRIVKMDI